MQVGITGHQRLDDPTGWTWVTTAVAAELDRLPRPLTAVTSLAIGADQLLARLVLERGGTVRAVLPFTDLERSFSHEDVPAYRELRDKAAVEVLETPGTDEDAYLAAGRRVADLSDVLVAVWNGKPAKGKGGTADVVEYAVKRGVPVLHINPDKRTTTKR